MTASQEACTRAIIEQTPDAALVSNLGVASFVLAGVEDRERNFYEWGSMGVTTPVGLGVSMGTSDPVTVLEGDGSLLMSLGSLATVARYGPPNLTIVVFDNGTYETTGGQPTHSENVDFAGAAASLGLSATPVSTDEGFVDAYAAAVESDETEVIVAAVDRVYPDSRPPYDFAYIKQRFRAALERPGR